MLKLKKSSLDWALTSALRYYNPHFPRPFEFDAIRAGWGNIRDVLADRNLLDYDNNGVRDYRRVLTAKSPLGFRVVTQLDPIDSILARAALYEVARDLESSRYSPARNTSFSFRLKPDKKTGMLFDPRYTWREFHRVTKKLAESGDYTYVVVTDIADFYPSVYLHHLETVLDDAVSASGRKSHVKYLLNYVKVMNDNQTHRGLPIGPIFSAPFAELVLDEIDRLLIADEVVFTRFVDDIRLFCKSEGEAHEKLAHLAQVLYDQRSFGLNEQKTSVLPIDEFMNRYTVSPEERQAEGIMSNFGDLIEELGIEVDFYSDADVVTLDEEDLKRVDELNLERLLEQELERKFIDYPFLSFLLGSLAAFDNSNVVDLLIERDNLRQIRPRMRSLVEYLSKLRSLSTRRRKEIGKAILGMVDDPIMGALPFNKVWLFSLFAKSGEWGNKGTLARLASSGNDPLTRRELLLAVGRVRHIAFFRSHRHLQMDADPWVRRALLVGMSCLEESERRPMYKARRMYKLDELDRIVIDWAEAGGF